MTDKKRLFSIQAEDDLLTSFKAACEANDLTQSQVLRSFMREYVKSNKQIDLFATSKSKKSK